MFFTFSKLHFVEILIFHEIVGDMERAEDVFGSVGKERKVGDGLSNACNHKWILKVMPLPFFFFFLNSNCWCLFSAKKRDRLHKLLKYLDGT